MSDLLEDPTQQGKSRWMGLSMLLHILAVIALIFLTPIHEAIFDQADAKASAKDKKLSTEQLEEVTEKLEEVTKEHIRRNLEALQEILDQMQEVNESQLEEYTVFEHSQIERTPEKIQDSLEQALETMKEAQKQLDEKQHSDALTQQALAQSHQDSMAQYLEFVNASKEVQKAHQEARETQAKATQESAKAKDATYHLMIAEKRLESPTKLIPILEARIPQQQEAVKAAKERISQTKTKLAETQKAFEETKAKENDPKKVERVAKQLTYAEKAVESAERNLAYKEKDFQGTTERLASAKAQVEELRTERDSQKELSITAHDAATQLQAKAMQLQTDVASKIAEDVAKKVAELQKNLTEDQTMQKELLENPKIEPQAEASALGLYNAALATEKQLAEKYRQGRAMQLTILQDVPFDAALDAIDLVVPVRPEISAKSLEGKAKNGKELEDRKEATRTALSETASMVTLGHSLLSQAIETQHGDTSSGGAISLANIEARSAQMQELKALADQGSGGIAADLSKAMQTDGQWKNTLPAPAEVVPVIDNSIRPSPGRKVTANGEGADWMAIHQWHVLGPFANPERANIDRVFPPESLVDLNAVYLGKDGGPIRWTYTQTANELGRTRPDNEEPYGIWYAYSELHFDQAQDLWIAMGSDDKGQVWVNDTPVWVSANHHKNWSPKEALRKVHFQKGRNRILYRIENGQHGMAFSLWVHLKGGV
jgi:hypothetical protein